MNKDLQVFSFESQGVRVVVKDGNPWWVAKDVADILDYSDTEAMTRRLDLDEVMTDKLSGMNMLSTLISESGLYNAIIGSKKPDAKKFKKWITSEVLPSIRKTGSYQVQQSPEEQALTLAKALLRKDEELKQVQVEKQQLQIENKSQAEKIEEDAPKVEVYDKTMNASGLKTIQQIAKILKVTNIFDKLKEIKILMDDNTPYKRYVDSGMFEVKTRTYTNKYGKEFTYLRTYVTGKGEIKLAQILGCNNSIECIDQKFDFE